MSDADRSQSPGIRIEARTVPFPKGISPQALAMLTSTIAPDGTLRPPPPTPAADDAAAWKKVRADVEKVVLGGMTERLAQSTASVETVEMGGAVVHVGRPRSFSAGKNAMAYIDIHGGALVYGGGAAARGAAQLAAERHGVTAYGVDYRMPPEHPYPAPLDDCLAVYRAVIELHAPHDVIVGGASAGGNLAAALMLRAREEGLPAPAALVLQTPEADLTESGDSFQVNRYVDVVLQGSLEDTIALYAGDHDRTDPFLSPLFGDFNRGFPPTILQAGTRDLFLSNAARLHRALRKAGVPAELHVFEGMPHGGFRGAPEDAELAVEVDRFVECHWGTVNHWAAE